MSRWVRLTATDLKLNPKQLDKFGYDIAIKTNYCNLDEFFTEHAFKWFDEDVTVAYTTDIYNVLKPLFEHVNDKDIDDENSKFCTLFYDLVCPQHTWENNYIVAQEFIKYIKDEAEGEFIYLDGDN